MVRIISIVGLCLVLLVATLGCGGQGIDSKANLDIGVSSVVALADSHIENSVDVMEILAMTPEVQSGNWETMLPFLTKADQVLVPAATWFALPDGSYYVVGQGKTDKNILDRAYFPIVMSGKNAIGQLVVSRSTGEKVMVTAVPVSKDGKVIGALGASIFLEDLSTIVTQELNLPETMIFYALTPGNEIALHTNTALILEKDPGKLDNAVFWASPFTEWRFALGYKK